MCCALLCLAGCDIISSDKEDFTPLLDGESFPGTASGTLNGANYSGKVKLRSYVNEKEVTIYSLDISDQITNYTTSLDLIGLEIGVQEYSIQESGSDSIRTVVGELYTAREGDVVCSKYSAIRPPGQSSGQLQLNEPFNPDETELVEGCFSLTLVSTDLRNTCENIFSADTLAFEYVCFEVPVEQ
jgi:hypothetical protein